MSFTEKNNNRKNHKGGDRRHIEARRARRMLDGKFGAGATYGVSVDVNELQLGTSKRPKKVES